MKNAHKGFIHTAVRPLTRSFRARVTEKTSLKRSRLFHQSGEMDGDALCTTRYTVANNGDASCPGQSRMRNDVNSSALLEPLLGAVQFAKLDRPTEQRSMEVQRDGDNCSMPHDFFKSDLLPLADVLDDCAGFDPHNPDPIAEGPQLDFDLSAESSG